MKLPPFCLEIRASQKESDWVLVESGREEEEAGLRLILRTFTVKSKTFIFLFFLILDF